MIKIILEKKYTVGRLTSPDFKALLSDSNQDKCISRTTDRLTEQSPATGQCAHSQLIFDKNTKAA